MLGRPRRYNCRRGAAAVELAVLLPFLAFLFLVATDFCRVFYYSVTLQNCARSGAVYACGVANYDPSSTAMTAATNAAVADGTTLDPPLTAGQVAVTDGSPDITVTVTYTFNTLTRYPGIPSTMTLTRTAIMRKAPQVPNFN